MATPRRADKAKRQEILPMLPDAHRILKLLDARTERGFPILPKLPINETLNQDMKKAGIAKTDQTGRVLDFHSLRYTFCTMLAKKLPIQKVMFLMRHKDIRLTANLYLDLGISEATEEEWKLPPLTS